MDEIHQYCSGLEEKGVKYTPVRRPFRWSNKLFNTVQEDATKMGITLRRTGKNLRNDIRNAMIQHAIDQRTTKVNEGEQLLLTLEA